MGNLDLFILRFELLISFKILVVYLLDLLTHLVKFTVLDFAHFVSLSTKNRKVSPLGQSFHLSLLLCVFGKTLDLDESLGHFLNDELFLTFLGLTVNNGSLLHQLKCSPKLLLSLFGLTPMAPVFQRCFQFKIDDLIFAHHVHRLKMDKL